MRESDQSRSVFAGRQRAQVAAQGGGAASACQRRGGRACGATAVAACVGQAQTAGAQPASRLRVPLLGRALSVCVFTYGHPPPSPNSQASAAHCRAGGEVTTARLGGWRAQATSRGHERGGPASAADTESVRTHAATGPCLSACMHVPRLCQLVCLTSRTLADVRVYLH